MVCHKGSEVGPGTERLRDLSAREMVDLRRPVLVPADDVPHAVGVAGSEAVPAGRRQVGPQAVAPPGRLALQMAAVMRAGRTAMVRHRCPAADGEDVMDLQGRVPPCPRALLAPRLADRHRRGLDDGPVGDPTQRTPEIDRRRSGVGPGPGRQGRPAPFQRRIEPPIAGGPSDRRHLTLQRRTQDIRRIGAPWGPGREHQRPHEHPPLQPALALDDPEGRAQAVDLPLGHHRLQHVPHLVAGHGLALRSAASRPVLPRSRGRASTAWGRPRSQGAQSRHDRRSWRKWTPMILLPMKTWGPGKAYPMADTKGGEV